MTTSRASFSWARPAMRRACSSEVSAVRFPAGSPESLEVPIEPEPRDLLSHRGRDEIVDRLALRYARADLRRADRRSARSRRARSATGRERRRRAGRSRAARRRRAGPVDSTASGSFHSGAQRAGRLRSGAPDRRTGVRASSSIGAGVLVELDVVLGKRELCEDKTRLCRSDDGPVARVGDDEDEHLVEREVPLGSGEQGDMAVVRRVESAAQDSRRHWYSSTSPSTSTSVPVRTPAARNASSSSSRLGGVPATR